MSDSELHAGAAPARVVLVRPQGTINLGAVARIMGNFGLHDLVLAAPRVDPLHRDALAMACAAQHILHSARVEPTLAKAVADCDWVCGTTARLGERRRASLTPRSAAQRAVEAARPALVFGPEDSGLSGDDLNLCHAIVHIPTDPDHTSINLAQAVAVVAYETWMAHLAAGEGCPPMATGPSPSSRTDRQPATAQDIEAALQHLQQALEAVGYFRQTVPEHPIRELRRFITRANPTRYELAMLRGMCRKTLNTLRFGFRSDSNP